MLNALLLYVPILVGVVVGVMTGVAIRHQTATLQLVLAAISCLFVFIASLMYLSVMPKMALDCDGWDCIAMGQTFNVVGLLGASLTVLTIVVTIFGLRLSAYKGQNDRRYWSDKV